MYLKICPVCGNKSYGADLKGQWICPYCGSDISKEPCQPLRERKKDKEVNPNGTN
ncbi:hypothetical protein Desca_0655 [Desulfotomaculum nigrificans CO-1-SRB]|uniref:Uncharacterized protein n=1 Tax=Desulfotomaculum nigrificans (strain DSM 14880 / VKM B-2319 / CO-1-SRB) TaxID=868595 RepID=F6B895_DESCC|nr:hypothetical protein Desca_0655 [Desulfotomaculum nigrificans CO-1-SRB]